MPKHLRYLNFAKNVAKLSTYHSQHIGCILVCKKQIVSIGWNMDKEHPIQKEYNQYRQLQGKNVTHKIHAETLCLYRASKLDIDFENAVIYVFRQWKNGMWALARPCDGCFEMIGRYGIRKIVYSTYGGYAVENIL